jgi:aminomethyltransferase
MGGAIAEHLAANKGSFEAVVTDLTDQLAKMDIQGHNAARILSTLIQDPESVFSKMPYFSFKGNFDEAEWGSSEVKLIKGTPFLLSRSGYTGEFGFEIFITRDAIVSLWHDMLEAGKSLGITACGLGSRDSLRAGACLPLSHQDIGNWPFINHPWDFALPYNEDKTSFTKDFIGKEALLNTGSESFIYPFAGDSLRKVSASDATQVLDETGSNIGRVLTCATDMGITWHEGKIVSINTPDLPEGIKIKGISCGFVMVDKTLEPGAQLTLTEGKRKIKATVVTDIRPNRSARKKLDNFI